MSSSNLKNFRDFYVIRALGVKIRPFPLTLYVGLTTVQRYRAACDTLQQHRNEKALRETQTLRAGCSKAEPKILVKIDARNFELSW